MALLAGFMAQPAGAADICWIKQVGKADAGMELTFDHGRAAVRRGGLPPNEADAFVPASDQDLLHRPVRSHLR